MYPLLASCLVEVSDFCTFDLEGAKQLQCLKTSTADYPYGYEYLKEPNWYSEANFPAMKSNVATAIIQKIKQIEEELGLC